MNHNQIPGLLTTFVIATLVSGFSQFAAAQETTYAQTLTGQTGCTREQRDIDADCGRTPQKADAKAPKAVAPIDLSGYWMSVITEDWRWRMLTPPKGDYASLPLNPEGRKVADTWDPKDVGSCKPFGAAGLMRNPLRVRFQWDDDKTLRVETDHGEQTRLFRFGPPPADLGPPSLQGYSVASWDQSGLKVVTTNLISGYLRKNGVPYSENAKVTEYYNRYSAFGDDWLTVTTLVEDPKYLSRSFNTSLDFKKLKDGSSWRPTPCKGT